MASVPACLVLGLCEGLNFARVAEEQAGKVDRFGSKYKYRQHLIEINIS
jgi:hypothetical protein